MQSLLRRAGPASSQLDIGRVLARADGLPCPETLRISDHLLRHHVYVEAVSGHGKTYLLLAIVMQLLLRTTPLCLIDPVGTLFASVLKFLGASNLKLALRERTPHAALNAAKREERHAWARRFDVLDFSDPDVGGRRYNPLEPQDGLSVSETVGDFLRCLERVIGDLVEMRRLQLVLRSVCTMLAEMGGTTLRDVPDFLCMDTEDINAYIRLLKEKRSGGKLPHRVREDLVHQYMAEFFARTSSRERRELVQSAYNAINLFSDAVVSRFVSSPQGNVSFSDIVNRGRFLIVHLPTGLDLNTQKVIGAMIVNRIQLVAERRSTSDVETGRVPQFVLVCDEFQLMFGRQWSEAIARVRNKGLSLVVAHQTDTQPPLDTLDGQSLLRSFRANASTHVYGRLWWEDAQRAAVPVFRPRGHELKHVERTTSETHSVSSSRSKGVTMTASKSESISEGEATLTSRSYGTSFGDGSSADAFSHSLWRSENRGWVESNSNGTQQNSSRTSTIGESTGESETEQEGDSYARGVSVRRDYYTVEEEIRIRAYELAELPRREAWVWINDTETASFKIRTHDIPGSFLTAFAGQDFRADFLRIAASPAPAPAPAVSLLERIFPGRRPST